MQTAHEVYNAERQIANELRKEKAAADEALNEAINKIASLNLERVDLTNIIGVLKEGIEQLARVKEAWDNVITFFNSIKLSIDTSLVNNIGRITNHLSGVERQPAAHDVAASYLYRSTLYRDAAKTCAVANVLMESAELYTTISDKFILPTINKSFQNMALTREEAIVCFIYNFSLRLKTVS